MLVVPGQGPKLELQLQKPAEVAECCRGLGIKSGPSKPDRVTKGVLKGETSNQGVNLTVCW